MTLQSVRGHFAAPRPLGISEGFAKDGADLIVGKIFEDTTTKYDIERLVLEGQGLCNVGLAEHSGDPHFLKKFFAETNIIQRPVQKGGITPPT